jgi:hypothetical protein
LIQAVARELLEQLVAFPSVAGLPNAEIVRFTREWLEARGARCVVVADPGGTQLNLLAETGPAGAGVLLSAHMDVVGADAADWDSDPFRVEERDGPWDNRHEGLPGRCHGGDGGRCRATAARAAAPRRFDRRGDRLRRSQASASRCRRVACETAPVHRRRTDRHAHGDGAQGQARAPGDAAW